MPVYLLEKVEELGCAVPLIALSDHRTGCDVESGKERRGAIADIGMRPSLGHAGGHGQDRLLTVQCLDLRFFVYTQHYSPVRR